MSWWLAPDQNFSGSVPGHKVMLVLVFLNFPFPATRDLTSPNMRFKICSSIRGWPECFTSLWAPYRQYNVELNTNEQTTPNINLILQFLQPSSITSCQAKQGCEIQQRSIHSLQIGVPKLHWKNKRSRLFIPISGNDICMKEWIF